ncbi:MAG: ABC transporter ATP-binding protein [Balneolales bacterium]
MRDLLKLNRFFKKYKGSVILGVLFLTLANVFLVWIPIMVRQTMDAVEQLMENTDETYNSIFNILFNREAGEILATNSLYLLGAVLLYGIFLFATRQTIIVTSRKIEYDLRNEIFDHLQKLPQSFFNKTSSGDVYTRATEDVVRVREYFGPAFMYTINTLTRAGIIITIMSMVNPMLTFWALLPLPFLSIIAYWVSGFIHERSVEIQQQYSKVVGRAQEAYSSVRLIKAYNREEYEQDRFVVESETYRKKKLKLDIVESLFHPTLNLLIGLSVVLVLWQGGLMVIEGTATVGNIAEFIINVAYLTWPIASLGFTLNLLQRSAASNNRIQELMNESIQIQDNRETDTSIRNLSGEIEFHNVSFTYPDASEPALINVNMKINSGDNIAIVGRTGCGKTTLVQLLTRLYDPQKGKITMDGIDIRKIPLSVLRAHIGDVPQETFLFSDTIGENIAFGVEGASENDIRKAADHAQILEDILEFDKKFKTTLGERGITLSGGQKQRTAIARALIRKPKILILDDSLSAVDTKTENAIAKHLHEIKYGTSILISHRISSVKYADYIYFMDEGTITECGTHEKLLVLKGKYADMYQKQLLEKELEEI